MGNNDKIMQRLLGCVRNWRNPSITRVSVPEQVTDKFGTRYMFTVFYDMKKPSRIYVDVNNPENWDNTTPIDIVYDLRNFYVNKMREQQQKKVY